MRRKNRRRRSIWRLLPMTVRNHEDQILKELRMGFDVTVIFEPAVEVTFRFGDKTMSVFAPDDPSRTREKGGVN
jgi:hypothetical protein